MATRKVTVTLSEELIAELTDLARSRDMPVSRLVAQAVARELRMAAGRSALEEWQHEHGPLTPEELSRARAEAAAADAELIAGLGHRATA